MKVLQLTKLKNFTWKLFLKPFIYLLVYLFVHSGCSLVVKKLNSNTCVDVMFKTFVFVKVVCYVGLH